MHSSASSLITSDNPYDSLAWGADISLHDSAATPNASAAASFASVGLAHTTGSSVFHAAVVSLHHNDLLLTHSPGL